MLTWTPLLPVPAAKEVVLAEAVVIWAVAVSVVLVGVWLAGLATIRPAVLRLSRVLCLSLAGVYRRGPVVDAPARASVVLAVITLESAWPDPVVVER